MISKTVTLQEITAENVRQVCELSVNTKQKNYVAENAIAIAEACYSKNDWMRAVYADDTPVGLMVVKAQPEKAEYLLWRFMIDAQYQQSNYGRRAIELCIDYVRTRPNTVEFLTSVVPGDHCPQGFYESLGFCLTGQWHKGEAMMKIML